MYYSVIIPSNDIYIKLLILKRKIFKISGLLSSWSLTPQVPVQFEKSLSSCINKDNLPYMPANGIELSEIKIFKNQCVLTSEHLVDYMNCISNNNIDIPGLHLFDLKEEGAAAFHNRYVSLLPELKNTYFILKSYIVKTFKTNCPLFIEDNWWENVQFEETNSFGFNNKIKQ